MSEVFIIFPIDIGGLDPSSLSSSDPFSCFAYSSAFLIDAIVSGDNPS